jgi:beta-galactosidase
MIKESLNGEWKFTKESVTPANFFSINWETVTVPHTWNGLDGQNGGNDYHRGLCWYNKTIEVKKNNGKVYLEFEGVNSVATVLLVRNSQRWIFYI